jgi:hypothetical protein
LKLVFNFFPVSKICIGIYLSFRVPLSHWVSYFERVQFSQPYQDLSFQCPRSITRVSFISLLIYVLFQEKTPFFHYATSSLSQLFRCSFFSVWLCFFILLLECFWENCMKDKSLCCICFCTFRVWLIIVSLKSLNSHDHMWWAPTLWAACMYCVL